MINASPYIGQVSRWRSREQVFCPHLVPSDSWHTSASFPHVPLLVIMALHACFLSASAGEAEAWRGPLGRVGTGHETTNGRTRKNEWQQPWANTCLRRKNTKGTRPNTGQDRDEPCALPRCQDDGAGVASVLTLASIISRGSPRGPVRLFGAHPGAPGHLWGVVGLWQRGNGAPQGEGEFLLFPSEKVKSTPLYRMGQEGG